MNSMTNLFFLLYHVFSSSPLDCWAHRQSFCSR